MSDRLVSIPALRKSIEDAGVNNDPTMLWIMDGLLVAFSSDEGIVYFSQLIVLLNLVVIFLLLVFHIDHEVLLM